MVELKNLETTTTSLHGNQMMPEYDPAAGIGLTPETTVANVVWIWSVLKVKLNLIGLINNLEVLNTSGPLDVFVTLMAVTETISSPRISMDGSGPLTRPSLTPQMEGLSMNGLTPEDPAKHNLILVKEKKPVWLF